jgi:hypothetical protein
MAGRVANMGEKVFYDKKSELKKSFIRSGVDVWIILKWMLRKQGRRIWNAFLVPDLGTSLEGLMANKIDLGVSYN